MVAAMEFCYKDEDLSEGTIEVVCNFWTGARTVGAFAIPSSLPVSLIS
jgi:hypothetical protein